jgi:hypothetical protein
MRLLCPNHPPTWARLLTLPEHMSSPPVFSGVPVPRSLVLYVCFVVRCLSFCTFFFGHCVVCSSLIYTDSDYTYGILTLIPKINTNLSFIRCQGS